MRQLFTKLLYPALLVALTAAGQTTSTADSPHSVQVLSSRLASFPFERSSLSYQELDCLIEHQHVRLLSKYAETTVLAPGDYKGILHDESKPGRNGKAPFDLKQEYILQMPDGTRRVYTVTGISLPDANP